MFRLYFGSIYVPVLNQYPIIDKIVYETGIVPEKINYWVWQTYPEKSYGKFLVSEQALLAAVPKFNEDDEENAPVPGFCSLQISDFQGNTITFSIASIKSITSWQMSLGNISVVDGQRLLAIEVELERLWSDGTGSGGALTGPCGSESNVTRRFASWSDMMSYLFTGSTSLLTPPKNFNRFINYHHVTPAMLAASVASMNGYVAFPSNTTVSKAVLGTDASTFSATDLSLNQFDLLFVEHGSTPYRVFLEFRMLTVLYAVGSPATVTGVTVENSDTPSVFYKSTVLRNDRVIQIAYPWELYDPDDPVMGGVTPGQFYADNAIEAMTKKLQTKFNVVCKGVYPGSLNQTLNYIEYSFARSGMITTLKTKEFKIHTFPFIDGAGTNGREETIFIAELLTDISSTIALGDIFHTLDAVTVLYNNVQVFDPLLLVNNYCAGTRCYVYKTLDDEFIIISGPCPPTGPCTPPEEPPPPPE